MRTGKIVYVGRTIELQRRPQWLARVNPLGMSPARSYDPRTTPTERATSPQGPAPPRRAGEKNGPQGPAKPPEAKQGQEGGSNPPNVLGGKGRRLNFRRRQQSNGESMLR